MNKIGPIIIFLLCSIFLCTSCKKQKEFESIDFKSFTYDFNSEIQYYLEKSKDGATWARKYALVNEHEKALHAADINAQINVPIDQDSFDIFNTQYHAVSAKEYILAKADQYEMIMFNEAHYFPFHFYFFKTLLKDLSLRGYAYVGLEGLGKTGTVISSWEDFYKLRLSNTPQFAEIIRTCLRLGITVFAYDEGSGSEREIEGAKNIQEFLNGKEAKCLILCGYDHIKESHTGTYWEHALAGRIKEYMGIDPLTINQTSYIEKSKREYEDPLYQKILPEESVIFIDKDHESLKDQKDKNWYDILIFHPRTKFENGRAKWSLEKKKAVFLELPELEINYPVKVLVYNQKENIDKATPVDITEITKESVPVYLPEGDFKIVFTDGINSYIRSIKIP